MFLTLLLDSFKQTPAAFAALLGGLQSSIDGSTLNVGLSVPESSLEQLFQQVGQLAVNHASNPAH